MKLSQKDTSEKELSHALSSTNLPFFESVWLSAKSVRGVKSILSLTGVADVVAENGGLWIKVSTITDRRMIMELAREGWQNSSDSDSDDDDDNRSADDPCQDGSSSAHLSTVDNEDGGVSIVKTAERMVRASWGAVRRVNYRRPNIRLILPRIEEGRIPQIDAILASVRSMGITVYCGRDIKEPPPIADALQTMICHDRLDFTETLNIDCTILLALVSDITHGSVLEQPWFNKWVRRQIADEARMPLLPHLWRVMHGRKLVCTEAAAQRMREIVATIGTPTEQARKNIVLGCSGGSEGKLDTFQAPVQNLPRLSIDVSLSQGLVQDLQKLSSRIIPSDLNLPIKIVSSDAAGDTLPPMAFEVAKTLSPINQSIFLYGWASGYTTLSSNAVVTKEIQALVEQHRTSDDDAGPDVWLSPTSRSLLAKEKERTK